MLLIREQRRFLRPRFPFARVAAVAVQSRAAHRHRDGVPKREDECERDFHIACKSRSSTTTNVYVCSRLFFFLVEYWSKNGLLLLLLFFFRGWFFVGSRRGPVVRGMSSFTTARFFSSPNKKERFSSPKNRDSLKP